MIQLKKRPCPVCGSLDAKELHRLRLTLFENHPLANDCVTAICLNCGMAFNRETLPEKAYNQYYSELSKYLLSTSANAPVPRLPECVEILADLLPRDAAILDAGCGSGGLLAALKDRGFKHLAGLDPTPECVKIVRDELGLDARVGMLDAPPFPPSSFDVVLSTTVFEHLLNPGIDVDRIGVLLKPHGKVFILVPDATRYAEFIESPFQDVNVEHINHFSPNALDNLFAVRGWDRLEVGRDVFQFSSSWKTTLIWGLYRKGGMIQSVSGNDQVLKSALQDYFAKSSTQLEVMMAKLQRDLNEKQEIIIWGAGHTTSLLLAHGGLGDKRIQAVIDSNPNYKGQYLAGVPVGGTELRGDFNGPIVVATIREKDSIIKKIGELHWPNQIVCLKNR